MKTFVYPYKGGSASAKAIADATGGSRIKVRNSKFKAGPRKLVVNWGSSGIPEEYLTHRYLNHPRAVKTAADKLLFFKTMRQADVSVPAFFTDRHEAAWNVDRGRTIVCRQKLNGQGGEGIVIADALGKLVNAPLYTLYVKKKEEYRVHVFRDEVLFVQRKARRKDVPDDEVNWQIRNHANGFIFAHLDVAPRVEVIQESVAAVAACTLDFGAVDVIWNEHDEKAYVLEVNCAPGLEGTTLERYRDAINRAAG